MIEPKTMWKTKEDYGGDVGTPKCYVLGYDQRQVNGVIYQWDSRTLPVNPIMQQFCMQPQKMAEELFLDTFVQV